MILAVMILANQFPSWPLWKEAAQLEGAAKYMEAHSHCKSPDGSTSYLSPQASWEEHGAGSGPQPIYPPLVGLLSWAAGEMHPETFMFPRLEVN